MLIDKIKEYIELQERKKYFRKRNDLYVDFPTLMKTLMIGFVSAFFGGFIIHLISYILGIRFSYFYIIVGIFVGNVVIKCSQVHSQRMAILSFVICLVGFICAYLSFYIWNIGMLSYFFVALKLGFESLFYDLFNLLFIVVGACCSYNVVR